MSGGDMPDVTDVPAEKYRAMRYIASAAHDVDDARLLLDAVFAIGRPQQHRGLKGRKPKAPEPNRSLYRYPVPLGDEGAEYRAKVRSWGRRNGHRVAKGGSLEAWLLNKYVDETGDVWQPASEKASAV